MKKLIQRTIRPVIIITIGFLIALIGTALTFSTPPAMQGTFGNAALFMAQPTSTPKTKDISEIGSTDGIVIMGVLIAMIIIVPLVVRRKSWIETH